jgi:hypothetical protein
LHELVHVAGGEELDAEYSENALFSKREGAELPTEEDEQEFKENQYRGIFVRLDRESRKVADLSGKLLGTLARRKPVKVNTRPKK